MSLEDQLKNLFPDHVPEKEVSKEPVKDDLWMQDAPIVCKYEKRNGRPITLLEGYEGADSDLKKLAKILKQRLSVGGSNKNGTIIIQGNYRDKIMELLQEMGFKVKRVGG